MKEKKLFTNERLNINKQNGVFEAVFSFTYKNKTIKKYYFLNKKEDARDIINHEKEDGTLLKYAKKYSRKLYWTAPRKAWMSCGAVLAAGVIAVGGYFAITYLFNKEWPVISVEEAKEIVKGIKDLQKITFDDSVEAPAYSTDEFNLIKLLKDNGGQGRINHHLHSIIEEGSSEPQEKGFSDNMSYNFTNDNLYFLNPSEIDDVKNEIGAAYYTYETDNVYSNNDPAPRTIYQYTKNSLAEGDEPDACSIYFKNLEFDDVGAAREYFDKAVLYAAENSSDNFIPTDSLAGLLFGINNSYNTNSVEASFFSGLIGPLTLADLYFKYPEGHTYNFEESLIEFEYTMNITYENVEFRSISSSTLQVKGKVAVEVNAQIFGQLIQETDMIQLSGKFADGLCIEESFNCASNIVVKIDETITTINETCENKHSLIYENIAIPDYKKWVAPEKD